MKINNLEQGQKNSSEKLKAAGILLAGGKSSRMKQNKAFLEFEGKPWVERILEVLQELFPEVLISSNDPELYQRYNLPIIQDKVQDHGPLAGLCRGLEAASFETVFFVACDMPFLDKDIIRRLYSFTGDYEIVVPHIQRDLHPLHAFYSRSCLPVIKRNLENGHLKTRDVFSECSVRFVEENELAEYSLEKIFLNVNTPEQWAEVLRQ